MQSGLRLREEFSCEVPCVELPTKAAETFPSVNPTAGHAAISCPPEPRYGGPTAAILNGKIWFVNPLNNMP